MFERNQIQKFLCMSDKPCKDVFREPFSIFMFENRKVRTIFPLAADPVF